MAIDPVQLANLNSGVDEDEEDYDEEGWMFFFWLNPRTVGLKGFLFSCLVELYMLTLGSVDRQIDRQTDRHGN